MARLVVGGIPVHPLLNDLPAALLPVSAVCDLMAAASGRNAWAQCAYRTLQFGTIAGLAAGAAGFVDYQGVPSHPEAQRAGRAHMLLNVGALAMSGLNLMLRDGHRPRAGFVGTLLSMMTTGALLYSGMQGGILAYKHRMALPEAQAAEAVGQVAEQVRQTAQRAARSARGSEEKKEVA